MSVNPFDARAVLLAKHAQHEAIAVLLVGLTGHLGGFLSGVSGPG